MYILYVSNNINHGLNKPNGVRTTAGLKVEICIYASVEVLTTWLFVWGQPKITIIVCPCLRMPVMHTAESYLFGPIHKG